MCLGDPCGHKENARVGGPGVSAFRGDTERRKMPGDIATGEGHMFSPMEGRDASCREIVVLSSLVRSCFGLQAYLPLQQAVWSLRHDGVLKLLSG